MRLLFELAWRQLLRNWHRSLVTTVAMAFACFVMIIYAALMQGMVYGSEKYAVATNTGDIQIHASGYREDPDLYTVIKQPLAVLKRLRQSGFNASARLYASGLVAAGQSSAGVRLHGIDIEAEKTVTILYRHLLQGRWLRPQAPNDVVIGGQLARNLGVSIGDELVFVGQSADGAMANDLFRVSGIIKAVSGQIDSSGVYLLASRFRELMQLPEGVHEIAIMRPDRSQDLTLASQRVASLAPGLETLNWRQLQPAIARFVDTAGIETRILIIITYIAVAAVVLNAMLMSIFERIHEFGVMKAIGFRPMQTAILIYLEALLQTLVAAVIGGATGTWAAYYLSQYGIDMSAIAGRLAFGGMAIEPIWYAHLNSTSLLLPVGYLFVVTLLATIYPAWKIASIGPLQAIHHP